MKVKAVNIKISKSERRTDPLILGKLTEQKGDAHLVKAKEYKCYFCSESMSPHEVLEIETLVSKYNSHYQEIILSHLKMSSNPREVPYIHYFKYNESDDDIYKVLNLCKSCFKEAMEKTIEFIKNKYILLVES